MMVLLSRSLAAFGQWTKQLGWGRSVKYVPPLKSEGLKRLQPENGEDDGDNYAVLSWLHWDASVTGAVYVEVAIRSGGDCAMRRFDHDENEHRSGECESH
jgi:hypothetical protein